MIIQKYEKQSANKKCKKRANKVHIQENSNPEI